MLPTQENLFFPLLDLVAVRAEAGKKTFLRDAYTGLLKYYPALEPHELAAKTGEHKGNAWMLQIRWAKKKLIDDCGCLRAPPTGKKEKKEKGECRLTAKGKATHAAVKLLRVWRPEYCSKAGAKSR